MTYEYYVHDITTGPSVSFACRWERAAGIAELLVELGMGYESRQPVHEPPTAEDYGCDWIPLIPDSPVVHLVGARREEYLAAERAWLSWREPGAGPGIPTHAVAGTNDGWYVTAAECAYALAVYDGFGLPRAPETFGEQFMNVLRVGAARDGFRVS
jgi:hypothetical protein